MTKDQLVQQMRSGYEAAITAICDMNKEILEDYCRRSIRPRIDAALSDGRDGEG